MSAGAIKTSDVVVIGENEPARVELHERSDWAGLSASRKRRYSRYTLWFTTDTGILWFGVTRGRFNTLEQGEAAFDALVAAAQAGRWLGQL